MDPFDMADICAFIFPDQLLKMKSSEDFKKEVAASSAASSVAPEPIPSQTLKPPDPGTAVSLITEAAGSSLQSQHSNLASTVSGEKAISTVVPSSNSNGGSTNGLEPVDVTPVTAPVLVYAKKSSPFDIKQPPPTILTQKPAEIPNKVIIAKKSEAVIPSSSSSTSKTSEPVPSTSTTMAPEVSTANIPSTSASFNNTSSTASISSVTEDERMTVDTSSDEEDDIYTNQFLREHIGPDSNHPTEELVIKRNSEYLFQRCASLMQRLQGIMQGTAASHVSKQSKSVIETPAWNSSRNSTQNRNSVFQEHHHRLTKQNISEVQFTGKVITNIIRHSMGRQLDPNEDSATEESDTDDDEVVLPDERLMDVHGSGNSSSDRPPYLPVENNPFIQAVTLEKQYEARRTSLDCSISECEYSLTKSLALRKHCKIRKPLFQLEKPSTSSNVINIPVDSAASVKFYHDAKANSRKRVCDYIVQRRSSLEQDKEKLTNGNIVESPSTLVAVSLENESVNEQPSEPANIVLSQQSSTNINGIDEADEKNKLYPALKTVGTDGHAVPVLGVEFAKPSDSNLSSSRCVALKRPDKNRKVFQLGGIHNIFRDTDRLPTLHCTCFGREELCALCLGRAKTKAEINHVHMSYPDKLAILDETFHKTLSFPEDVPLEVILASSIVGSNTPLTRPTNSIQQLIKARSQQFPPDLLETGPRPKKPRTYDIKPYVETPVRSPKKDNRYSEEAAQSPRKRPPVRKSQSSFEEREHGDFAGKGLGLASRERKDSIRRTRNQEFDIDNIVIPYSMAATTRVEQLVYKPIETPRWRILEYDEIFGSSSDKSDAELEDMSNAAFQHRHNKCEIEEKKKFSQSLQKALNATRKTRRLDSTCRSESDVMGGMANDENSSSSHPFHSPEKTRDKEGNTPLSTNTNSTAALDGAITPVTDTSTVITEAMANQALKSLFKVGSRRRTVSTSNKVEEVVVVEEDPTPAVFVDPWPQRKFPLADDEYKEMLDSMELCYSESSMGFMSHNYSSHLEDSPSSPNYL